MTVQGPFAGTRPIAWPRAAIGAAVFFGLMVVLFIMIPNLFVTSDPSQFTKIITIAYIVVLFALVAWMTAAWQNRGQAAPQPETQRVSAFGRPMRAGPGFASFAERAEKGVPIPKLEPVQARFSSTDPSADASSFGRPVKKKGSQ